MFYESSKQIYGFRVFKRITSFGDSIYNHKIKIHEANQEQAELLKHVLSFNNKSRPRSDKNKNTENDVLETLW